MRRGATLTHGRRGGNGGATMWSTGARIGRRCYELASGLPVAPGSRPSRLGLQPKCRFGYITEMASTWAALSDPHRRAVLALLRDRPRPVGELVERLGLTQPGTSKHLRILREAGLVRVRREAQRRVYELETAPLAELDRWLAPYRQLWEDRLDALERHLDNTHHQEDPET